MDKRKERRQSLHYGIRMKRTKPSKRKVSKKLKKKRRHDFQNVFAPICGLFVFVGLVAYRNYLLSAHDSEVVMLHHYKRYARNRHIANAVNETLNERIHITETQQKHNRKGPGKQGILSKVLIPTPSAKNKKLALIQMSRRYDDRKKLLIEKCGGALGRKWDDTLQLIAAPDQNVTVCIVQKAGSTSWHKMIYKMRTGQAWVKSGHQSNRQATIDLSEETKELLTLSIQAKRIITVRHPFSRLISGWHNKFYKDFEKNGLFMNKLGSYAGRHHPEENHVIAFRDLVEYIADTGLDNVDVHFKSIAQLCKPCQYPYDYIVRAETVLDDLWYVLEKINSTMDTFNKHVVKAVSADASATSVQTPWEKDRDTIKFFFKSVPRKIVKKLMVLYSDDFENFGYTFDYETDTIGDIID